MCDRSWMMGDGRHMTLSRFWSYRANIVVFFFFNDTATTEIYTLSLHDALPIPRFLYCPFLVAAAPPLFILTISCCGSAPAFYTDWQRHEFFTAPISLRQRDRKSTRLNSSHTVISYAVFCLKKKKKEEKKRRKKRKRRKKKRKKERSSLTTADTHKHVRLR